MSDFSKESIQRAKDEVKLQKLISVNCNNKLNI